MASARPVLETSATWRSGCLHCVRHLPLTLSYHFHRLNSSIWRMTPVNSDLTFNFCCAQPTTSGSNRRNPDYSFANRMIKKKKKFREVSIARHVGNEKWQNLFFTCEPFQRDWCRQWRHRSTLSQHFISELIEFIAEMSDSVICIASRWQCFGVSAPDGSQSDTSMSHSTTKNHSLQRSTKLDLVPYLDTFYPNYQLTVKWLIQLSYELQKVVYLT